MRVGWPSYILIHFIPNRSSCATAQLPVRPPWRWRGVESRNTPVPRCGCGRGRESYSNGVCLFQPSLMVDMGGKTAPIALPCSHCQWGDARPPLSKQTIGYQSTTQAQESSRVVSTRDRRCVPAWGPPIPSNSNHVYLQLLTVRVRARDCVRRVYTPKSTQAKNARLLCLLRLSDEASRPSFIR